MHRSVDNKKNHFLPRVEIPPYPNLQSDWYTFLPMNSSPPSIDLTPLPLVKNSPPSTASQYRSPTSTDLQPYSSPSSMKATYQTRQFRVGVLAWLDHVTGAKGVLRRTSLTLKCHCLYMRSDRQHEWQLQG